MFSLILSGQTWLAELGSFLNALIADFGGPGLLLLAIFDSSFLSFPEGNDLLIVILSAGQSWSMMAYFVAMTITGSIIGCLILYSVGRRAGSPILKRRFSKQNIARAERLFRKYGVLTVLLPSILPPPMPFKIFVLSAGVFRVKALSFLTAVLVGRTIRYSMWGILAVLYGNSVKTYMQDNLTIIGIVLTVIFIIAFVIILTHYFRHSREGENGMSD